MADIEDTLKTLLQRQVRFVVNNKVLKEGRIVVFNIKDFYISFVIHTKKQQTKTYEIPVPYSISTHKNNVLFNYSNKLIAKNSKCFTLIKVISKEIGKKSKLFDNMLTIECE